MSASSPQNISEPASANPKVSVAMITYNHEKFIAQAVESVMMQQTKFDYEVVIGEDCSTDNTRGILLELRNKYPERIKLLLHDRNLGPNENFKQTLHACQGQYLAILEGDDYWTSPYKLQKQIDALDKNPDWSICTHRIRVFFEDGSHLSYLGPRFDPKPVSTLKDLALAPFVGTSAAVYRRIPIYQHYPDWIFQVEISDYALSLFYSKFGKIGFIDEVMCVYRKHKDAFWSQRDPLKQRTELARSLNIIAKNMSGRPRRYLESQAAHALRKVVKIHLGNGAVNEARKVMRSIFPTAYFLPGISWRRLSRTAVYVYAPGFVTIFHKVKQLLIG